MSAPDEFEMYPVFLSFNENLLLPAVPAQECRTFDDYGPGYNISVNVCQPYMSNTSTYYLMGDGHLVMDSPDTLFPTIAPIIGTVIIFQLHFITIYIIALSLPKSLPSYLSPLY